MPSVIPTQILCPLRSPSNTANQLRSPRLPFSARASSAASACSAAPSTLLLPCRKPWLGAWTWLSVGMRPPTTGAGRVPH